MSNAAVKAKKAKAAKAAAPLFSIEIGYLDSGDNEHTETVQLAANDFATLTLQEAATLEGLVDADVFAAATGLGGPDITAEAFAEMFLSPQRLRAFLFVKIKSRASLRARRYIDIEDFDVDMGALAAVLGEALTTD